MELGDYRRAIDLLQSTLQSLGVLAGDYQQSLPIFTKIWLGFSLADRGDFAGAIAYGRDSMRAAEALDDAWCLSHAYLLLGDVYHEQGKPSDAIQHYEQTDRIVRDRELVGFAPKGGVARLRLCQLGSSHRRPGALGRGRRGGGVENLSTYLEHDDSPAEK